MKAHRGVDNRKSPLAKGRLNALSRNHMQTEGRASTPGVIQVLITKTRRMKNLLSKLVVVKDKGIVYIGSCNLGFLQRGLYI